MNQRAVVAFPSWDEASRLWVESVRAQHDPQAQLIRAHFTLVFPMPLSAQLLVPHLTSALAEQRSFAFTIRRAVAVAANGAIGGHVFLMPDRGGAELSALHRRLHTDVLLPHLRPDMPYLPHITVAAHRRLSDSEDLAGGLNERGVLVAGAIDRLDLVDLDEAGVHVLATFVLPCGVVVA